MDRDSARRLIAAETQRWVADPESDVVWAGSHEGRWGIRMAQQVRDFTTVWFDIGDRTAGFEAYVLPSPPASRADVFELCLRRNWRSWPAHMALDDRGDLFVVGRIPLSDLDPGVLDRAVGAVYELIELSFRRIVRLGFRRPAG
jgi:hypothetical protein